MENQQIEIKYKQPHKLLAGEMLMEYDRVLTYMLDAIRLNNEMQNKINELNSKIEELENKKE